MTDLTLAQRFGSSVTFNETTKVLSLDLNNLTDAGDITNGLGLDISSMSAANADTYSSKILAAILNLNYQNQPENNTDETVLLFISQLRKGSAVVRNAVSGVSQFPFQQTVILYAPDNLGNQLDPDALG